MTSFEKSTLIIQSLVWISVIATLIVYFFQLRTMQKQLVASQDSSVAQNILAVVNFLQSEDVRSARGVVRRDLRNKAVETWNDREREAASCVCANYDVASVLLRENLVPIDPIIQNWGPSIKDCYEILSPYIKEFQSMENSGPDYWDDFSWLYEQVIKNQNSNA